MRFILILLFILLSVNKTRGEDISVPISLSYSKLFEENKLTLKNEWFRPEDNYYEIEYKGFYKLANDKLRSLASKYYNKTYNQILEIGNYNSYFEFTDNLKKIQTRLNKKEDPRWNRNFWEFYPEEKGGTVLSTHIVGSEIIILDLNLLSLNNAGRLRLNSFDLSFNQNDGINFQKPNIDTPLDQATQISQNLEFALSTPEASLKSSNIEIRFNFSLNLKTTMSKDNSSSARITFKIQFLDKKKKPWLEISTKIQTQPITNQHSIQLFIEVLNF